MSAERDLSIATARVFKPLLKPARYKGAHGGRGSGKSHFFAGLLIEECLSQHIRAACLREVQTSIKESVKQLLEDKIRQYGVERAFQITDKEIRGPHDGLIVFKGLQTTLSGTGSAFALKSAEAFNRAWYEEAQALSVRSIETATPTFREAGTEQWFSWNPTSPKDAVEQHFASGVDDPDFINVEANWRDNPWFPPDLKKDMLRDRRRDPDKYAHVWMGKYRKLSQARVFHNWCVGDRATHPLCFEPPSRAVFYQGADWGYAHDPSTLVRCFIIGRTLYVIAELYAVGVEVDHIPAFFDRMPNARRWAITADSARPETISYTKRNGYPLIKPALKGKGSVEDGVEWLKSFDIVVHPDCEHTIDELSMYSWKVDDKTNTIIPKLDDAAGHDHCIDALRYAVEDARRAPMVISDSVLKRAGGRY